MANFSPFQRVQYSQRRFATRAFLAALFSVGLLVTGCAVGGSDDEDGGNGGTDTDGERTFSIGANTDERGRAVATFQLSGDTTKLSVSAFVDDNQEVRFTELSDERGTNYLDPNGDEVTFGTSFARGINVVNAPSRAEDQPIDGSQSFTAEVEIQGAGFDSGSTPVTFLINSKADTNLSSGRLKLNIFYVGEVGQEPDTKEVIAQALPAFRDIYGAGASIDLDVSEFDVDGPVTLPVPFEGAALYERAATEAPSPSVNLFVSGSIQGDTSDISGSEDLLGLSSGIPGPPVPSIRSAVAVGIFAAAGPDGLFSQDDVRVLGETMAHEVGHFMGLFHPVDFESNVVTASDPLSDTPICRFLTECLTDRELTSNLMFFTPVSDGDGGFIRQNLLSTDQRGVLNRYVVTD